MAERKSNRIWDEIGKAVTAAILPKWRSAAFWPFGLFEMTTMLRIRSNGNV